MRKIDKTDKILSISHDDMDGVGAQIVLGHIFKDIYYINTSFVKLDRLLKENFDPSGYDHVFITDIYPNDPDLINISDKIVLLDHHESSYNYNNPDKNRFIVTNQCATKLTKKFAELYFKIKLPELDELVYLINDYDMWIHDDKRSKQLDLLFQYYKANNFRRRFFNGNVGFTEGEKNYLRKMKEKFDHIYDNLNVFEFPKTKACLVVSEGDFLNDICEKLMNDDGYKIVFFRSKTGHLSIRSRIKDCHIGNLLKEFGIGGGHKEAAGCLIKEPNEQNKFIQIIVDTVHSKYNECRRR